MRADIGLIGLAVMGQNLALNFDDHGYAVAVCNRTTSVVDEFLTGSASGTQIVGAHSIEELVAALRTPRRVMLMVRAGAPVDDLIARLLPLLDPGDIIIDGGNSHFKDTMRRWRHVTDQGRLYIGTGISGGEEGARNGPSIMPGGSREAWPVVREMFQAIAAKVPERDPNGEPCCEWIGADGAGHYVKMVHNGIEYGDMQVIAEAYHLMRSGLGLENPAMGEIFRAWDGRALRSYLIHITGEILSYREPDGSATIDLILDAAGQKGTGRWTVESALEQGVPLTLVAEAVFARALSAMWDERQGAASVLAGPPGSFQPEAARFIEDLEQAVYASKIVSYAQGFMLMTDAARAYGWQLDYGSIARIWRGGCIIRSAFLGRIEEAYDADPTLPNLMVAPYFRNALQTAQGGWRRVVAAATAMGIPAPAMASALAFYDGYRTARLPANLVQAQRDYFGAHTYERFDRPRGEHFHTNWTGEGGGARAGTYGA